MSEEQRLSSGKAWELGFLARWHKRSLDGILTTKASGSSEASGPQASKHGPWQAKQNVSDDHFRLADHS
jgi:hypothetical protein